MGGAVDCHDYPNMKKHPRLTQAHRRHLQLMTRVIDAITYDWEPGLATLLVAEYAAKRAEQELRELIRHRQRTSRQLNAHIRRLARDIFTTDEAVMAWLSSPAPALRGRRPRDLLATKAGARQVQQLLRGIAHGNVI